MAKAKKKPTWKRPRLAEDRAWSGLQELLESGSYPPGSRLPAERELCERCGVSRVTLRRALKRLAKANRLDARVGSGTFVKRPPPSTRRDIISLMYLDAASVPPEVKDHAAELGCDLVVYSQSDAQWKPEAERLFLRDVRDRQHRGLLAFCTPLEPHSDSILRDLENSGVRVMHIEHGRLTLPRQPFLLPDFRRAGHMAAVDLMLAGYEHIFWVGTTATTAPYDQLLRQGFVDAMAEHRPGVKLKDCLRLIHTEADIHAASIDEVVRSLPPDSGVVVYVAAMAAKLRHAAEQAGLDVPGQYGFIGIDLAGKGGTDVTDPPVDILTFDRPTLLKRALDCMLDDDWNPPRELVMPTRLRRGSVRK